ncbi:MAG: serine/threonine-protein kinase [Verrucomicrobiota bacterium]
MQSTFIEQRYMPMYEAGFGGTANIYAAFDTECRELVAIKCISREAYPRLKKRDEELLEELSLRDVDHPHVMRLLDRFWHEGQFCLVTELIWGLNLEVYLYRRFLKQKTFVKLARQMLAGLAAIHDAGYLHGDIKPQNMMIHFGTDSGISIKILDFGLADILPDSVRFGKDDFIVDELFATPEYVAPELIKGGTPSQFSDIYSMGQTFYHCLSGEASLVADSPEDTALIKAKKSSPSIIEKRTDLNPKLAAWVDKFLTTNPRNRWSSAEAALEKLDSVTNGE